MAYIGISIGTNPPLAATHAVEYVEIKRITAEETLAIRSITDKPIYFHLQFTAKGKYLLPTAMDFEQHTVDFEAAARIACPEQVSLHFGLSAPSISIDKASYFAFAAGPPLTREVILSTLEKNLHIARKCFPQSILLLENQEFIPDCLCGGAYRYIQESDFLSEHVIRWYEMGLVDGIVFDVAHALITAGNHPYYNGLAKEAPGRTCYADTLQTDRKYIHELSTIPSDRLIDFYSLYIHHLPLHLIREIHISGIQRNKQGVYVDAHNEIGDLEFEALRRTLRHSPCTDPETMPVTLEYSRNEKNIIPQLTKLRELLLELHSSGDKV